MRVPSTRYLAGYFDGEGCIGIYRNSGSADARYRSGKRPIGWVRSVAVNACHKPILDALASRFGGKVRRQRAKTGNKTLWTWAIGSRTAIEVFLSVVRPHLWEKQAQAELMLMELRGAVETEVAEAELKVLKRESVNA